MGNTINMFKFTPVKDDVITIPLPKSDIVFTRYLYLKDEVELSLVLAILNKDNREALFWAYELYYSGFKKILFDLFWKIYYDFFASQNPSFEPYLIKKQKAYYSNDDDKIVAMIIENMTIRDLNVDTFMLRTVCNLFEIEYEYVDKEKPTSIYEITIQFKAWLNNYDCRSVCAFILESELNIDIMKTYYSIILDMFGYTDKDKDKENKIQEYIKSIEASKIDMRIILVARILSLIHIAKSNSTSKPNNFYIIVEEDSIVKYKTIFHCEYEYKTYRILENVCRYSIEYVEMLNLFCLNRRKYPNILDLYRDNWLYHASFSPIWFKRISNYNGFVDYSKEKINFKNDEYFEEFYSAYNYEPDEQTKEVQNRNVGPINTNRNWLYFYNRFNNNGLINITHDELEELFVEPILY
jgi:hypothetical protein